MSSPCGLGGSTKWYYTGNQVGDLNFVGDYNFVAGGPDGSGISGGTIVPIFTPPPTSREPWNYPDAKLSQELLDNCFPFIELNWIADIWLGDRVFRVSDKNIYVQDSDGLPRFYEARCSKAPKMTVTTGEWLAPNFEIGDLNITLNNRDGFFNDYLPNGMLYKQWIYAKIEVRVGFGEKYDNYFTIFTGFVAPKQGISVTETDLSLKVYDRFDRDEIPLPALFFNEINYPDLQDGANGKGVPLVYGDWMNDSGDYGYIPAYCLNALEVDPSYYVFKISSNALSTIGDVYLHRGNRNSDVVDGPVKFDSAQLQFFPERGEFWIPTNILVLTETVSVMEGGQAGSGSGSGLVTSDNANVNFILKGVKPGDQIVKTSTSQTSTVLTVASNQITLTTGLSFTSGDEYSIRTRNFTFRKGDKISLFCLGKNIQKISVNRLADFGLNSAQPIGLTVGLDGTYWFADNSTQKIYQISFFDTIEKILDYSDVGVDLTDVGGLTIQTDNTLWIYDRVLSKFYRFDVDANATALTFLSSDVPGMPVSLGDGRGLTIDTGNFLYILDNVSGQFYVINPFTPFNPTLIYQWSRSAFDSAAVEILDLCADVNANNLCVVDRTTGKFYRINKINGSLISQELLTNVSDNMTWCVGVSTAQDGTVFFLNRADLTLYNYNEDPNSIYNPGFIARDIIQSQTGKVFTDFDLSWNQTSRLSLNQYRCRAYIDEKTNAVTYCNKMLQQFNAQLYIRFNRYALFHIEFDNFVTTGKVIREGDIKENSFNASREYNQYFNSAYSDYSRNPFSGSSVRSDTYISPSGVAAAGREISKKMDMPNVYLRADIDKIVPLFVRLSAAEPEFLTLESPFRRIFSQLFDFYNIDFYERPRCDVAGQMIGGRRYNMTPTFVRQCEFDLDTMSVKMKLWSLGTTAFGGFVPPGGLLAGGEGDKIVITNLGTVGYISPIGTIINSGPSSIFVSDVDGQDAETRTQLVVGLAWKPGYRIAIIDASTEQVIEEATILSVSGQEIIFNAPLANPISISVLNAAGFISSGYYIKYAIYSDTPVDQRSNFAFFAPPVIGYPSSTAVEIDEQRAGLHSFPDARPPYVLFPFSYAGV